ncbi:MAG: hypothetical protein ACOYM3_13615 [Terrimicrobiaceae bacterium]
MTDTTHLASLLTMPTADFDRYWTAVKQIASWRQMPAADVGSPPANPVEASHAAQPPARHPLPQRNPMRAPKPSSLRGAIHDLLRTAGKPLQRAQIISEVATLRNDRISENYKAKVGDLLTNRHDPCIRRVGHGIYTYAHE